MKILINLKLSSKIPFFWLKFLTSILFCIFLIYIVFIYFFPFGLNTTLFINVGSLNDDSKSDFYLDSSSGFSKRKKSDSGHLYRELSGKGNFYFNPKIKIKNVDLELKINANNVELIAPIIDFDYKDITWDDGWNFNYLPTEFNNPNNKIFYFEKAIYFSGKGGLELKNSHDKFKTGPFSIYLEWMPIDVNAKNQRIIGHNNWTLIQNRDELRFLFGNSIKRIYTISYEINDINNFFNKKNKVLINYDTKGFGYIELYLNNSFVERINLNGYRLRENYEKNKNFIIGAGSSEYDYFKGIIYRLKFKNEKAIKGGKKLDIKLDDLGDDLIFRAWSPTRGIIKNIELKIKKNKIKFLKL